VIAKSREKGTQLFSSTGRSRVESRVQAIHPSRYLPACFSVGFGLVESSSNENSGLVLRPGLTVTCRPDVAISP
jgi:hypothetical protein